MHKELVIFDCDGVLVDSEVISARTMREMALERGVSFDGRTALTFIRGRKVAEWVAELESVVDRSLQEDFVQEFRDRCAAAFDRDLSRVDGVDDVLATLDMTYCCASSAPREKILHTLGRTDLLPFFEGRIYSAYEVGVWKPDPGLFQYAAEEFGVPPDRCAVVEDSVPGVQAGVRAGMTVFGYAPSDTAAALAAEGAHTFRAMGELPRLLDRWRQGLPAPSPDIATRRDGVC